jgi:hypothetical protein
MAMEAKWLISLLVFSSFSLLFFITLVLRTKRDKQVNMDIGIGDIVRWKHSYRENEWLGGLVVGFDEQRISYTIQPFHSANSRITLLAETYGEYWFKIDKSFLK